MKPIILLCLCVSVARALLVGKIQKKEADLKSRFQGCQGASTVHGIEYAMMGYNILHGFPKAQGVDPGWRAQIFEAKYDGSYTPDCKYQLPAGISIAQFAACSTSFHSHEVKNAKQLADALAENAVASESGAGPSFSASRVYKEITSDVKDNNNVYIYSDAACIVYTSEMDANAPPPLSNTFMTQVRELGQQDSSNVYFDFFEMFGTHFPKTIKFGARYTLEYKMTNQAYQRAGSRSYSVATQAIYSALFSLSPTYMSPDQKNAARLFQQDAEVTTNTLGSVPSSGDVREWQSAAEHLASPVEYTLEPIEQLFTAKYFQGISGINYDTIKSRFERYKVQYCQHLVSTGEIESCATP